MSSNKNRGAQPDYAVSFKEYIHEWLEETDAKLAELDVQLEAKYGITLSAIMATKVPLDARTAEILESIIGIPVRSWLAFDAQYHRDVKRLGLIIK